ncbi:hypothetical protein T492DRAFT_623641 [Pavlovales sp. CCMP2436]|nr:hypothetical protein T492DRAFT_623641 [Pavlovales sp. CCMP2436]
MHGAALQVVLGCALAWRSPASVFSRPLARPLARRAALLMSDPPVASDLAASDLPLAAETSSVAPDLPLPAVVSEPLAVVAPVASDLPPVASRLPPVRIPTGWKPPEPKPLSVPDGRLLVTLGGTVGLIMRLGTGVVAVGWKPGFSTDPKSYNLYGLRDTASAYPRPALPLKLYEYEPSPYCRKVREACSMLSLNVTMLPCPRARQGFAAELLALGGKQQVPFLVDPNSAAGPTQLYESDDIIDYLFDTYGPGRADVPWTLRGPFAFWTCAFAALARGLAGNARDAKARAENEQREPIVLWGNEGSPFVKPVRERLVELALPHTFVMCPRGSAQRDILFSKTGRFQVPYLDDPNTGAALFESDAIIAYLNAVYTVP